MGPLGEFQPLGGCVTRTLMPSLPPVNKGARECFMGLCLKINEVRTCRGSCLARKVGVHIFPREQRVREGQAGEHAHIWKILHTSVSTVSSSGSPGWECVTFFHCCCHNTWKAIYGGKIYFDLLKGEDPVRHDDIWRVRQQVASLLRARSSEAFLLFFSLEPSLRGGSSCLSWFNLDNPSQRHREASLLGD